MDSLSKAKKGLAKMLKEGADAIGIEGVLDEFPNAEILAKVQKLTIKIESMEAAQTAISRYVIANSTNFESIKFKIRKEGGNKAVFLMAELEPESGFTVYEPKDDESAPIMNVNLPFDESESIGKIKHPSGPTLYEVLESKTKGGHIQYMIKKTVGDKECLFLRKQRPIALRISKLAGLTFDSRSYRITQGREIMARIVPRLSVPAGPNSYAVRFTSNCKDVQVKAVAIGVGLLLTLNVAFYELKNLLKESVVTS